MILAMIRFCVWLVRRRPALWHFCGRLVLWGARNGEDMDRMVESELFRREWDELREDMRSHLKLPKEPA